MRDFLCILLCILFIFITPSFAGEFITPSRDPFVATTSSLSSTPSSVLISSWIPLYFTKANKVVSLITKPNLQILSPQGKALADDQNNQILVIDDLTHINTIRKMIHHLDQVGPQFLIKAKIINIDQQYQKSLGVLFQTTPASNNPLAPLNLDEPRTNTTTGQFTINLAKLADNNLLDLQISALQQEGHATLISNPALVTLNNLPAVIESGAEVPYQESTASGATSTTFKKAALQLKVTPQLIGNHRILLHIALNQDQVSDLTVNGVPAIQTQQLTTQVIVQNHQTLVLGGILETSRAKQSTGIPVVNDIPVIGTLLRHHTQQTKEQELLIFITPAIMH